MSTRPGDWLRLARDQFNESHVQRLRAAGPRFQRLSASALLQVVHRATTALADLADGGGRAPLERWSRPLAAWLNRKGIPTTEAAAALDMLGGLLQEAVVDLYDSTDDERSSVEQAVQQWLPELRHVLLLAIPEERSRKLKLFQRWTTQLLSVSTLHAVSRSVLHTARLLTDARCGALALYGRSPQEPLLEVLASDPDGEAELRAILSQRANRQWQGNGNSESILDAPALFVGEVASDRSLSIGEKTLSAPLMRRGRVVGDLVLAGKRHGWRFTAEDFHWAGLVADHAASALVHARVRDRERRRLEEHRILVDLSRAAAFASNTQELVRTVFEHLGRAIPFSLGAMFFASSLRNELYVASASPPDSELLARLRARTCAAVGRVSGRPPPETFSTSLIDLPAPAPRPRLRRAADTSFVELPVLAAPSQELVGVLVVCHERENAFRETQRRFLQSVAVQAGHSVVRLRIAKSNERKRLEHIVDRLDDGVLLLDDRRRITVANETARHRLRLLGGAGVGQTLERLGPWRLDELLEFARQTPPLWVEVVVEDPAAGGSRSIEVVPQVVGTPARPRATVLVLRDITPRRMVEQREANAKRLAAAMLDTAPAIVALLDDEFRVVRVNAYVEEFSGNSPQRLLGLDWFEHCIDVNDAEAFRQAAEKILHGERLRGHAATLGCRGAGEGREFAWWGTLLPEHLGEGRVLLVGHDLTPLREAQERALQSERLAAIGQMTTGLGHESRNALQRSQAALDRLRLRIADRPDLIEFIDQLESAQEHLLYLYDEVRDYAAPVRLRKTLLRPWDVVADAWKDLMVVREGRGAQLVQKGDERAEIVGDPHALKQVFRNILENSLAACVGCVVIQAEHALMDDERESWFVLTFRDNGPGFSAEARMKLFEPFFSTKVKGTGLGMPIARRLVEAHGGAITVGASCRPGAEILVELPKGH